MAIVKIDQAVTIVLMQKEAEALERLLRSEKWSKADQNVLDDIHNAVADAGVDGEGGI